MKKLILLLVSIMFTIGVSALTVFAGEETALNSFKEDVSDELFSSMSEEVSEVLDAIGISGLDLKGVYNLSLKTILSYFTPQIKEKASDVFASFFRLAVSIMLIVILSAVIEGGGTERTFNLFSTALMAVVLLPSLSNILNAAVSVLKISNGFILSYIPVLTLILSFSGNGMSAMMFNSMVLGVGEIISAFINNGLIPCIGCFICLSITFSLQEGLRVQKLIAAVNKTVTLVLAGAGSLFSGILTVKNVMAVSMDSLSVRGVRFLISSFIPVIGSSISEAYSSIMGSINLIKGSVAVIGIIAVLVINLPVIAETFMYYLSFSSLSYLSEISSCNQVSDIFKAASSVMRILLILIVFQMFILIISTGIILTIKNT